MQTGLSLVVPPLKERDLSLLIVSERGKHSSHGFTVALDNRLVDILVLVCVLEGGVLSDD